MDVQTAGKTKEKGSYLVIIRAGAEGEGERNRNFGLCFIVSLGLEVVKSKSF